MKRGTTPTLTFGLPFSSDLLTAAYITFSQNGSIILEKELSDCTPGENSLELSLSQEDTLLLDSTVGMVMLQLRVKFTDGSAAASDIMHISVGAILKDGVI